MIIHRLYLFKRSYFRFSFNCECQAKIHCMYWVLNENRALMIPWKIGPSVPDLVVREASICAILLLIWLFP